MDVQSFLENQSAERKKTLLKIHKTIIENDKTVIAGVEPMMGKEMVMYKQDNYMKYALADGKKYMSLHVLPIYANKELHEKYKNKLRHAAFQKGCINFLNEDEMPVDIVSELIRDCSKINLAKIREEYLKNKKVKKAKV